MGMGHSLYKQTLKVPERFKNNNIDIDAALL